MRIDFVTYGNHVFTNALRRIETEAENFGLFDNIHAYEPNRLPRQFRESYQDILEMPRGGGYWIWKPWIIAEVFESMSDGDYLIYADAGCEINSEGTGRFKEYIELLDSSAYGCLSFQMWHLERNWTKRDVFDYFRVDLDSDVATSGQLVSGILLFKKCRHSAMLIDKWLSVLYQNPRLFTDHCDSRMHHGDFSEHRYDQSIFSIIRKLYGSVVIPDETYSQDWSSLRHIPFLAKRQKN
uniref:Capsular polysaccharide synthesis protein n=1 Tax=Candidatus Kentrum sp. DK TaxID=2126562 RepID=A0A450SQ34_9GAMM|nr:MAG: hypothetical protein BECKDK2373C_GA0170839_10529 [Candidatus Kentron sp. DK]